MNWIQNWSMHEPPFIPMPSSWLARARSHDSSRNHSLLGVPPPNPCQWLHLNQGYAGYEKIYLGSVFFFQLSGGNLTNSVIRGITIYGNSRDYRVITSHALLGPPEEMHDGHIQFLGTRSIPMHAMWYCKSNCFCECGPSWQLLTWMHYPFCFAASFLALDNFNGTSFNLC